MPDENRVESKFRLLWKIVIILVLFIGAAFGYAVWYMLSAHTYDPAGASTSGDVASLTSVPPPRKANNFRVATFDYGQARLVFVRFCAPVDICQKYAASVMPGTMLKPLTVDQKYADLMAIRAGVVQSIDLRWFDLPYAGPFWATGQQAFQTPSQDKIPDAKEMIGADANTEQQGYLTTGVRVDTSRDVFYFLRVN